MSRFSKLYERISPRAKARMASASFFSFASSSTGLAWFSIPLIASTARTSRSASAFKVSITFARESRSAEIRLYFSFSSAVRSRFSDAALSRSSLASCQDF